MNTQIEQMMIENGMTPYSFVIEGAAKAVILVKEWGFDFWREQTGFSPKMQEIIKKLAEA